MKNFIRALTLIFIIALAAAPGSTTAFIDNPSGPEIVATQQADWPCVNQTYKVDLALSRSFDYQGITQTQTLVSETVTTPTIESGAGTVTESRINWRHYADRHTLTNNWDYNYDYTRNFTISIRA